MSSGKLRAYGTWPGNMGVFKRSEDGEQGWSFRDKCGRSLLNCIKEFGLYLEDKNLCS